MTRQFLIQLYIGFTVAALSIPAWAELASYRGEILAITCSAGVDRTVSEIEMRDIEDVNSHVVQSGKSKVEVSLETCLELLPQIHRCDNIFISFRLRGDGKMGSHGRIETAAGSPTCK